MGTGAVLPRPLRGPRAVLGVLFGLLALLAVGVAPASAHDQLLGTDPAADSALATPPTQVVLTFSADQLPVGVVVEVTGPDGAPWSEGEPVVAGATVTQALRAGMPGGAYAVAWRSPSSDGHVLDGTFAFQVAEQASPEPTEEPATEATVPAEEPTAEATPEASTEPTTEAAAQGGQDGPSASTDPLAWLVAGLVVVVVAGVVTLLVARRRAAHRTSDAAHDGARDE